MVKCQYKWQFYFLFFPIASQRKLVQLVKCLNIKAIVFFFSLFISHFSFLHFKQHYLLGDFNILMWNLYAFLGSFQYIICPLKKQKVCNSGSIRLNVAVAMSTQKCLDCPSAKRKSHFLLTQRGNMYELGHTFSSSVILENLRRET